MADSGYANIMKQNLALVRSAKHFSGNNMQENMKRTNWVRATYDTFLLHALQAGCGCTAVFSTMKKPIHGFQLFFAATVWLYSFTEAH